MIQRILRHFAPKHSALTVTHKEAVTWFERRRPEYESLIQAVQPYVKRDAIIFDIGANIGYFTLLLSQQLGFMGSAYLFEPIPHLAALCKTTLRDSTLCVTVLDFGLSDSDSDEDLFLAADGNLGWNTLVSQKATSGMRKVTVTLRRFDACDIDVTPAFIKIDVEGAEYKVLRGMLESLRRWTPLPVILCEVGWGQTHPAWAEEMQIFTEMKKIGYTLCDLDGRPINENSLQRTTDILFIPEKA